MAALFLNTLFIGIITLLAYFLIDRIIQYRRLRHIPGPPTTGISLLWHSAAILSWKAHWWYADAVKRYGSLTRIGPNLLVTSSPELWMRMNGVRTKYERSPWFYHGARLEPGRDNVFTQCDGGVHDGRRRAMGFAYTPSENPTLESSIDGRITALLSLIRNNYATSSPAQPPTPMDLAQKLQFFSIDTISEIAFGQTFGHLEKNADFMEYIRSLEEGLAIGNVCFGLGIGWLRTLPVVGGLLAPDEGALRGFGRMVSNARACVRSRASKSTAEKSDMLASFIRRGITGDDLFQEAFVQIVGGTDTTATSLQMIMLAVMTQPRVYRKLQAEIDSVVEAGGAPGVVSDAVLRKMVYLQAVVKEGMRLCPPSVTLFPRVVPEGGDTVTVGGKEVFLPSGTEVGISITGMQRLTSVFGDDAEVFRPERWIVDDGDLEGQERLARMIKVQDLVFGYGRWKCLGRGVGLMEIFKGVFELVRHFEWGVLRPDEPLRMWNVNGLFCVRDFWVSVEER